MVEYSLAGKAPSLAGQVIAMFKPIDIVIFFVFLPLLFTGHFLLATIAAAFIVWSELREQNRN